MPPQATTLETPHGTISYTDSQLQNDKPALLLIHGNTSSSLIFKHILQNETFNTQYRLIAFDLPGHGLSGDAPDPTKSYTQRAYAEVAAQLLENLRIKEAIVFGWSLGGHSVIELIPLLPPTGSVKLKGVMITGTPPANGLAQTNRSFTFTDGHMSLSAQEHFTEEQIQEWPKLAAGGPVEDWMFETTRRTDGRARVIMWKSFVEARGVDQIGVVEGKEEAGGRADVLIGVVNGGSEPFVNLDYIDEIKWKNLWRGKCIRLEGLGHAPFWEKPEVFHPVLLEFLEDCEKT